MKKNNKNKKKILLGPVITIIILIFTISIMSAIFSLLEVQGQKTEIVKGVLETSLVTVNNVLTVGGIKYLISNAFSNLQLFAPLVLLIISLIAIGIGEASGFFRASFQPLKKLNTTALTFLVLFIGIIFSFFGDFSYTFLIPLIAIMYETIGKKPLLGILTVFIGITIGGGAGLLYNYSDIALGSLTQLAATVDVDKAYVFNPMSNMYIMIASTFILSLVGTLIITKTLDKRVPKSVYETDDFVISKKALYYSNLAIGILSIFIIYMITPGFYGSGLLLGEGATYIEKLLGPTSLFNEGFVIIVVILLMIAGCIYGYISKNIKNTNEYSVALSKSFEELGYVFVLLFFTAQMVNLLEWTNIGTVVATNIITFLSTLPFSGIPLVITVFLAIILMSILIPDTYTKWMLASPILIPLLMKSNITPNFSQFIFNAADSIGKAITPMFAFYIIMLAFLEKYNTKENNKITVFGTIRLIFPCVLLFAGLWLLILISWYIVGLPLGSGVYSTL